MTIKTEKEDLETLLDEIGDFENRVMLLEDDENFFTVADRLGQEYGLHSYIDELLWELKDVAATRIRELKS